MSLNDDGSLRVLLVAVNYFPETTGIAPYVSSLAKGLSAHGMSVDVITAYPHYPQWRVWAGHRGWTTVENVKGVRVTRVRHFVPRVPRATLRLLSELTFGLRLLFGRVNPADVVVSVSPALFSSALLAMKVRRSTPLVVWVQDIYTLGMVETGTGGGMAGRMVELVESRLLRRSDRVVVIHRRFVNYLTNRLGVDEERLRVVRNWTHLGTSSMGSERVDVRRRFGWSDVETVVLHSGNMGVKQGLENVVAAARLADDLDLPVRFVLLGDGAERQTLVKLGQGVSRLDILDPVDEASFSAVLEAADILLVNEKVGVSSMAVPSKLTSYFSAGRPVLAATDLQGITAEEVRNADGGVVVEAGTPEALVRAALRLGGDYAERARLGRNGREYCERVLSEEAAIRAFAKVLRSVGRR